MRIPAASIEQVRMMGDGRTVVVQSELSEVAKRLEDISIPTPIGLSSKFELHFNEGAGAFAVVQVTRNGEGEITMKQIVTTWDATTAGPVGDALVQRVERIMAPDYDAAAEAEAADRAADREREYQLEEAAGVMGEKLFHAMRRDLGRHTDRAFFKDRTPAHA